MPPLGPTRGLRTLHPLEGGGAFFIQCFGIELTSTEDRGSSRARQEEGRGPPARASLPRHGRGIYGQIPFGSSVTPSLLAQVLAVFAVPEPVESSSQSRLTFPDALLLRI